MAVCLHTKPFECSPHRSALDKKNFNAVGLTDQIVYQVDQILLREMVVELTVGEALAVFAVDAHDFANILKQFVSFEPGQNCFDDLQRIRLETKLC